MTGIAFLIVLLFTSFAVGVEGTEHQRLDTQDSLIRMIADMTGANTGLPAVQELMTDLPVTMSGKGQTVTGGPLRLTFSFGRSRAVLASLIIGEDSPPVLTLFRADDLSDVIEVVPLADCVISRIGDDGLRISKGDPLGNRAGIFKPEQSWQFIAPSFQQREKWANALAAAASGDEASLAVPALHKQGAFDSMAVGNLDAVVRGKLDPARAVLELHELTADVNDPQGWWTILADSYRQREQWMSAFSWAISRGRHANPSFTTPLKKGQFERVVAFEPDTSTDARLDPERFVLDLFEEPTHEPNRRPSKSIPIFSLTSLEKGRSSKLVIKNPKLSDTVTLKASFDNARDDWLAALNDVKSKYDRSFPEVAEGARGASIEHVLFPTGTGGMTPFERTRGVWDTRRLMVRCGWGVIGALWQSRVSLLRTAAEWGHMIAKGVRFAATRLWTPRRRRGDAGPRGLKERVSVDDASPT
eukprot:g13096.t1